VNEKLLILDLDETLLHASEHPLDAPADFRLAEYHVYLRPEVAQFLEFCRAHFRVAVWTSSTELYATAIVDYLFGSAYPLEFVWARQRCTRVFDGELQSHYWVKDLKKVRRRGYPLEKVLMIDDTPEKLSRHYGNLVRVRAFEGDNTDAELRRLMPYLLKLKAAENVRAVEKRYWRTEQAASSSSGASPENC
jgi:RNA polymerase II subunit A small phosphatase-like protein